MRHLFTVLSLATLASAQRTWVVDAAGGAGVDFRDIPPAVAAATDGDTVVVRHAPSPYRLISLSKALRMVGIGRPLVQGILSLQDIAAGKTLAVSGLSLDYGVTIGIERCAGAVIVSDIVSYTARGLGLSINRCAAVSLSGLRVDGVGANAQEPTAVLVRDSSVYCTDCFLLGADQFFASAVPAAGISVERSRVVFNRSTVAGGRVLATPMTFGPAIIARNSVIAVTGGTQVVGLGALAIDGVQANAVIAPNAILLGAVSSNVRIVRAQVPASSAVLTSLNNGPVMELRCDAQPGDVVAQALGLLRQPAVGPFGEEWLDLASAAVVDVGIVVGTGRSVSIPTPARGVLSGLPLVSQALVLRGSALSWSTPATFILE